MKYVPKREGLNPDVLVILCLLGAVLALASALITRSFAWIFHLLIVGFLTAGLYLLVRFRMTSYEYYLTLRDRELLPEASPELAARALRNYEPRELEFSVEKVAGRKKTVTDCRFYLNELVCCERIDKDRNTLKDRLKEAAADRVYTYTVSVNPLSVLLLVFSDPGYGRIAVILETDELPEGVFRRMAEKNAAV